MSTGEQKIIVSLVGSVFSHRKKCTKWNTQGPSLCR